MIFVLNLYPCKIPHRYCAASHIKCISLCTPQHSTALTLITSQNSSHYNISFCEGFSGGGVVLLLIVSSFQCCTLHKTKHTHTHGHTLLHVHITRTTDTKNLPIGIGKMAAAGDLKLVNSFEINSTLIEIAWNILVQRKYSIFVWTYMSRRRRCCRKKEGGET